MLYLLLIIPHLAAITGLLMYALLTRPVEASEDSGGSSSGADGEPKPPPQPPPGPAFDGPPLGYATAPGRRLRDTERLSDLHPRRPRREHDITEPSPAPTTNSDALSELQPL
jgi:hypothetical protein